MISKLSWDHMSRQSLTIALLVVASFCLESCLTDFNASISSQEDSFAFEQAANNGRFLEPAVEDTTESLSVDVTFESILKTVVFLLTSWLFGALSAMVGLPTLVGEIVTGFVLGPPLLDFVPYPEAMVLIGSFGLIGLLLDSGINLDIAQLKETGSRAFFMAITGTILAMGTGIGMGRIANQEDFRVSMAVGAAFAPSSLGVASQVLSKGEVLNTPTGQVIVAASVVDDICGLILLSIMEVLVQDSPPVIKYIIPFLSSFGYLIVLGYVGVTWVPYFVENIVLPRFPSEKRDTVALAMMFFLLSAYLPLLYYSGSSYLTGAFLAGLSFSQVNSVRATYAESEHEISAWLMRIFFTATIGFQVPIKYFTDGDVMNWGFYYLLPVFAKIPLGLLIPRFQRDLPDDFPYDPYWRDVLIATLAMLCRGEFNFIVASFALRAGVLDPEHYAAVVFAILISAVICPLALSQVIRYYGAKFNEYLKASHKIERIGNTPDGTRPVFWAIQARTPVKWGLQHKFKHALETAGLIIVDHRSWHTQGLDAVDITEIFCQDKEVRVRVRDCFNESARSWDEDDVKSAIEVMTKESTIATIEESPCREVVSELEDLEEQKEDYEERKRIQQRKDEIRQLLVGCLDTIDEDGYAIRISRWWETFGFEQLREDPTYEEGSDESYLQGTPLDEEEAANPPSAASRFVSLPSFGSKPVASTDFDSCSVLDEEMLELKLSTSSDLKNIVANGGSDTTRPHRDVFSSPNTENIPRPTHSRAQSDAGATKPRFANIPRPTHIRSRSDATDLQPRHTTPPRLHASDLWHVDDSVLASGGVCTETTDSNGQVFTPQVTFPASLPAPRRGHHRRVQSFDVSLLDDGFNHDCTIKNRLAGYIRPSEG